MSGMKKVNPRGPIVPRMVKPPSIEKVREILDQALPEPAFLPGKLKIGHYYKGQGVYIGQWTPFAQTEFFDFFKKKPLRKTFNVFAAPEDLPGGTRNYLKTQARVATLKNWHGYDGADYLTDKEIYVALKEGSYDGGWIIPPKEIQKELLARHREAGALAGTFKTDVEDEFNWPRHYWSSTVYDFLFSDNGKYKDGDDVFRMSCRPVRLVPA